VDAVVDTVGVDEMDEVEKCDNNELSNIDTESGTDRLGVGVEDVEVEVVKVEVEDKIVDDKDDNVEEVK